MLKEFVEVIAGLSVKASAAHELEAVDPRARHYYLPNSCQTVLVPIKPPLRNYTAADLETIVRLWQDMHGDLDLEIWVGDDRVTLLLDRDDRRETAVYMFRYSDRFRELSERLVRRSEGFTQKELCQFLRLKLGLNEATVGKFRALQWSSGDDANSTVQRGVDKLGASIRREVINAAEIPDELYLPLAVFDGAVEKQLERTVTLLVELDTVQRLIWLVPKPGDVVAAVDSTLTAIQAYLAEATQDELIYRGTPG